MTYIVIATILFLIVFVMGLNAWKYELERNKPRPIKHKILMIIWYLSTILFIIGAYKVLYN